VPAGNAAYSIQTAAMETPDLIKTAQRLRHKPFSLVIRWLPVQLSAASRAPALLNRPLAGFRRCGGKLNIDANDLVGVTICQATKKRAEELPLAAGLARAYDLAADHPIMGRPVHPARIQYVLMLDPSPALGCFEGAQFAGAHRVHERLVKIDSGPFENLKANHTRHLPLYQLPAWRRILRLATLVGKPFVLVLDETVDTRTT
jgi:hypothetical protein